MIFNFFGDRGKNLNKVLLLIDWENLLISLKSEQMPSEEGYSITAGFDRLVEQITLEIGEIVNVFIFAPPHILSSFGETFVKLGFFPIVCPKVRGKTGEEEDTTDSTLINFGRTAIEHIKGLTHLCIGSGDKDFSLLVRQAKRKGLKILVVASSNRSLATELIQLANQVFIFSPTESEA